MIGHAHIAGTASGYMSGGEKNDPMLYMTF